MIYPISEDIICLYKLEDFLHHQVQVSLFWGCIQSEVIERGEYVSGKDHIVCAFISCLYFDQILDELEVMVLIRKNFLHPIHVHFFVKFHLHYFQSLS